MALKALSGNTEFGPPDPPRGRQHRTPDCPGTWLEKTGEEIVEGANIIVVGAGKITIFYCPACQVEYTERSP